MKLLMSLIVNFFIGFVTHVTMYPVLERTFKPKTARLLAYVIGEIIDLFGSWFVLGAYHRFVHDRRQEVIPFERYLIVRFLSSAALGLGVGVGYLLDED